MTRRDLVCSCVESLTDRVDIRVETLTGPARHDRRDEDDVSD